MNMENFVPLIYCALIVWALSSCTTYNVRAVPTGDISPVITCQKATQQDEGGVCFAFYGCSDGKDHTDCTYSEVK
jgi:hypothetical protein